MPFRGRRHERKGAGGGRARWRSELALLSDGRVLVAGGSGAAFPYSFLSSAEIYSPASGTWASTGSMSTPRFHFTATLLPDGRVLAAAGQTTGYAAVSAAERFDAATGTWTSAGELAARYLHTATLLSDGQVLVAGGEDSGGWAVTSAQLFNPATGAWVATGSLLAEHAKHRATLLPDGKVLVTGRTFGRGTPQASSERYNSTRGTTTPPSLSYTRRPGSDPFRISFTSTMGALFTVSAATDIASSAGNWTPLGVVLELLPGQYEFSDGPASPSAMRFYRVSASHLPPGP